PAIAPVAGGDRGWRRATRNAGRDVRYAVARRRPETARPDGPLHRRRCPASAPPQVGPAAAAKSSGPPRYRPARESGPPANDRRNAPARTAPRRTAPRRETGSTSGRKRRGSSPHAFFARPTRKG